MTTPLLGKLAFVTGAGSGIGREICRILARDGAKVIAADRNVSAAKESISKLTSDSTAIEVDVSNAESISNAITEILAKYKAPPTIIVNSAGITRDNYILKMSEQDFEDVCNVNLKGTFLITQKFAKAMVDGQVGGSIVNLSSIVAKLNSIGQANYAASKSGVCSITSVASKEFGKFNIRVNAVLPGYINTPMVAPVPEHLKKAAIAKCPLNRFGEPKEIAEVVSFLCSDKASYVNGAMIEVTGGLD